MYLLFYPEEEEFLRFRDFRGKFVGERRARRAYRFQNSAEDQKSAADTISVHEKKIRRVAAARRPWLNFEHDPAALVCPIQRISKRFKQPRFSNANNLFSLLSLSYPNYYPNGKKEYSWFVTRNRKYEPRVFFREKKKGGTFEKIFERIESLRYVREQRNIFPKMDTSSIHIYIFQDLSIRYRNLDPSPSPFLSMIYYSDPHSPLDRFTQLLFPRWAEKWRRGWKKEGGISRRKPGLKVARRLFARRES